MNHEKNPFYNMACDKVIETMERDADARTNAKTLLSTGVREGGLGTSGDFDDIKKLSEYSLNTWYSAIYRFLHFRRTGSK